MMLGTFVLAAQSEHSRILNGGILIVMGLGIIAFNRTAWSWRLMRRVRPIYFGQRLGDGLTWLVHSAWYVVAVFFVVVGLVGVTGVTA